MFESNDFDGLQKCSMIKLKKIKGLFRSIHTLNQSIQNLECSNFFKPQALMINSFDIRILKLSLIF